ncbi:hypothetical protein [Acrocarpospora pleiomorpha]|nr:hypothetical protein [Acrocarpospora pleiomorpha]
MLVLVLMIGREENHKPALVAAGAFASGLAWWVAAPRRLPHGSVEGERAK